MKYLFLLIGIAGLILLLIIYFQGFTYNFSQKIPFLQNRIDFNIFTTYLIIIAIFTGVFLTLGVKGILDSNKDLDDGFEL
ncbi:hypothetical protein [Candidatus Vampirococcus lugosii]|uniref:DUF1049 domain-containing protein n=1 Tax=Candidatus Vampirococcus lugosii TaxID=2789015 RepID=A0ABS5QJU2_9BACT|nr:hypothetical protein [Candidatus Vampirococcus lugosii]MBS8121488.1 hypothetical protein [Candidatus Vampirococcus lugosii]